MRVLLVHAGRTLCAVGSVTEAVALKAGGVAPADAEIVAEIEPADLRAEYRRRLCVLLEATDLAHAAYVRADDADETVKLLSTGTRTVEEEARLGELLARRAAIEALIAAYNTLDAAGPIPTDFAADQHWP